MKAYSIILICIVILFTTACKKEEVVPVSGVALEYKSLKAEQDTLVTGNKTKIIAVVTGSNITYKWSGPVGIISGSGSEVFFFACCPGNHPITCTVSDATGKSESKTVNIYGL